MLFQHLGDIVPAKELQEMESEFDQLLKLPADEKEARSEAFFRQLAVLTSDRLALKYQR